MMLLSVWCLIGLCLGVGGVATDAPAGCTRKVVGSVEDYTNNKTCQCQALVTFRAAAPYRTIRSISLLFKTDPSSVSTINGHHSETTVLEAVNRFVVIRGNCRNTYNYQINYVTQRGDTVYSIANQIYQGLTTCRAIFDHNPTIFNHTTATYKDNVTTGMEIVVPLGCACPTKKQTKDGIKSLMTYIVEEGDTVATVSERFKVDQGLTLKANNKLSKHDKIDPFTTLLVPFIQTRRSAMSGAKPAPSPALHHNNTTPSPSKSAKKSNGGGFIGSILRHVREHQFIYKVVGGIIAAAFVGGFGVRVIIKNCACCNFHVNRRSRPRRYVNQWQTQDPGY